jgi:Prealbumin-like fold domain
MAALAGRAAASGRSALCFFVFFASLLGAMASAARADTLDWATRPLTNINGASDVAIVNGVTITTAGSTGGTFSSNLIQIQPAGSSNGTTGFINSTMNASTDDEVARQIVTITFSEPVYNVSFTVWDLDGGPTFNDGTNFFNDVVTFTSSAGVPTTGAPASQVTWTPATGRAQATANAGLTNANGNITVTFAGPVTSVTINHIAGAVTGSNNPTAQAVFIEDLTFFKRPQLTLVKTVTNDNGGTSATSAFPLTAAGPSTITGVSGAAAVTNAVLVPGTYALSETGPTGYAASAWSCNAGTLAGANLTLAAGQLATCTINNNDTAPRLTLVKTVINDSGGAAATSAFTLTAAGPTTISGISGAAAVTNAAVNAGVYALSETAVAGYAAGAWSCTAGTLAGSNLTLTVGQVATCTIVNNDQPAALTLLKTVTNDNGGTNVDTDFTLTATGPTTITGIEGAASVTAASVNAGTYLLTESGAATANYTQGTWSCTAGTLTGNSLVLANGQSSSCTITNNDRPRLTLLKTVINNSGGAALDTAFTLTATGPVTISGIEGNAAVTNASVNAGTYALTESSLAGYTGGAWSCVGGTLTGSSLVLTQAQNATCTVSNDDQPATLTLLKTVTNDNGGTNIDTDFTLTATGPTTITGIEGAASVTAASVNAGTYLLTESGAATANYTQGTWSCTAGTLTGNSLVLANGQTASCTITNNDRPRLTLLKTVINNSGGAALDTAFTLTATGPVTISGIEGNAAVTNASVNAGTYALTESSLAGYTGGAWSCVGGTLTGSSLVLTQAQNATCTVSNDDQPATLTLTKVIVNTGGGTAILADFPLTAAGPTTITGISGAAPVTGAPVSAGTYALSEITNSNYSVSAWSCTGGTLSGSSLTLALGQSASCTITNTFVPAPALTIDKTADTAGPLVVGQTVNYNYLVTNTGNVTISSVDVTETAFNGTGTAPIPVAGGSTTIAPGQTVTFTASYVVTQQDVDTLQ